MNENKELILNGNQISYIVASFLIISFFIFILGYYWGKRSIIEPISKQWHNDTLADKVKGALLVENQTQLNDNSEVDQEAEKDSIEQELKSNTTYFAQIAGFANLKSAQNFADRLKAVSSDIVVTTRSSKNSNGVIKKWYQVTTKAFTNKSKLLELINRIKKIGQLKGNINIIAVNNNER